MKYLALLRGINVGGNSMIKMSDLKRAFEKNGYHQVQTYINSGNVIFESDVKDITAISAHLETVLSKIFHVELRIVVRTYDQLLKTAKEVPAEWKKTANLRCYLAFVREPIMPRDVLRELTVNDTVDFVKVGDGVVYMSTLLTGITKSGFTKLAGKKIYKDLTIRNYNTLQKLLALMEK